MWVTAVMAAQAIVRHDRFDVGGVGFLDGAFADPVQHRSKVFLRQHSRHRAAQGFFQLRGFLAAAVGDLDVIHRQAGFAIGRRVGDKNVQHGKYVAQPDHQQGTGKQRPHADG